MAGTCNPSTGLCSTPNKATNSPYTRRPFNPFHLREFTLNELERLLHGHFPYVNVFGQNLIRLPLGVARDPAAGTRAVPIIDHPFPAPLANAGHQFFLDSAFTSS